MKTSGVKTIALGIMATIIMLYAISKGMNGVALTGYFIVIGGLGGYGIGKVLK